MSQHGPRPRFHRLLLPAALALVPIVIMIFYLLGARALGAFESL